MMPCQDHEGIARVMVYDGVVGLHAALLEVAFPVKGQNCIDELCERISWLDLKYDTICTLHDVFGCDFNPIEVSNLFPNKK